MVYIQLFVMDMRFLPKMQLIKNELESCHRTLRNENSCPANLASFFGNYQNKENFVKALARYLMDKFKVIERPSDADTTIVKEALMFAKESAVTIFSDDTDILYLSLIHI